jgi:hypothetical protein
MAIGAFAQRIPDMQVVWGSPSGGIPEDSPSGLWRTLGKRVGLTPSGVRIPHPPPKNVPQHLALSCWSVTSLACGDLPSQILIPVYFCLVAGTNGYWKKHPNKELQLFLVELHRSG